MFNRLNQPKGSTIGVLRDGRTVEEVLLKVEGRSPTFISVASGGDIQKAIDSLGEEGGCVFLGPGEFTGSIQLKSGVSLVGSGRPTWNGKTSTWSVGTLINGSVAATGANGFSIRDLGIDSYSSNRNAISGTSASTGNGIVHNVSTRANNHGHLWEANDDNPENSNAIGNIVVTDCIHYGGPNGFVTKHKDVSFIRCTTYGVTIQGFVVVSDNINGATKFSRAVNTVIRDCKHCGDSSAQPNNEGIRIYSREYDSASSKVKGTDNVMIVNFNGVGCAGAVVRAGENAASPPNFKKVVSTNISILNLPFNATKYAGLQFDSVYGLLIDGCAFGNKANVDMKNNSVDLVYWGAANRFPYGVTRVGVEGGRMVVTNGETTLSPRYGQKVIDIKNTENTTITKIDYCLVGREHYILINDDVTTVNLGTAYSGKGTVLHIRGMEGDKWCVLGNSTGNA